MREREREIINGYKIFTSHAVDRVQALSAELKGNLAVS